MHVEVKTVKCHRLSLSMMSGECQSKMSGNVGGGMAGALFGCQHPPACTEQWDRTGGRRHQC